MKTADEILSQYNTIKHDSRIHDPETVEALYVYREAALEAMEAYELEILENLLERMNGVHSDYHKEIIEHEIEEIKKKYTTPPNK